MRSTGSKHLVNFCYGIFFASGAAALILEISWSRQIGLLFGHTTHAAAVVLAGYFVGSAIGSSFGGRIARRLNPLRAYAVAELIAGSWACLVPLLLSASESPTGALVLRNDSPVTQLLLRAVFCLTLLLPATVAIGGTLPLMTEFLSRRNGFELSQVSRAYAFNTVGAVVGVVATTTFLLVVVGVRASGFVAAGISACCAIAAFMLDHRAGRPSPAVQVVVENTPVQTANDSGSIIHWKVMAGVFGFGTLAMEMLYLRLFSLVFHNSTYTFGTVVAVFLLALALGAGLSSVVMKHMSPLVLLAGCSSLGGALPAVSVLLFVNLTGLRYFESGESFMGYILAATLLVAVIVIPPVTILGMALPAIWKVSTVQSADASKYVGSTTMVNTLAAAIGAVVASFVMLPMLGLWKSFAAIALVLGLVSCVLLQRLRRTWWSLATLLCVAATVGPLLIPPGPERWVKSTDEQLIRRWHSSYGWVDVVKDNRDGSLKVRQNRHYRFGSTGREAQRMYRQAHLPLLLHSGPRDVVFLGLGTGLTAAGAVIHDEPESITIVELVPEVVDAARLLSDANFGIVDHPLTHIDIDDARHFLRATDQQFDVIVSDLFVPWESETGYLYTVEHYQQARSRLREGGLFCQWLPLYQLGAVEFEMIANSFANVFPRTTLWWGQLQSHRAIVALVGTAKTLELNESMIDRRIEQLSATGLFHDDELSSARRLHERLGGGLPRRSDAVLNTDEHPRIEFLTPASHQNGQLLQNQRLHRYFEKVMLKLPPGDVNVRFEAREKPTADEQRRRDWLRFILLNGAE